ncbi:WD40 repeat domain-containing protein [Streptomyces griseorubiginosus]|uniref:WD40 repeat domain-containing protein n=1 Tax=Streptomyces griseorubiginosus TaxID=67304 RepID=UPI0036BCD548
MGRPEKPVDPLAGPIQKLAHELRELRRSAGGPSYRTMARTAGFSATTLADAAGGDRLPSLVVFQGYVRACGADPGEWEARWKEAAARAAGETRNDEDAVPPYRGLARFEMADRELFFGRGRLTEELCALVSGNRLAVVFGASGSGKSSLLRAGLIPRLQEEAAKQKSPVVLRVLTPGPRPATMYGHLLLPEEGEPESWVVVDQFEEIFTLCRDRAERDRFLDLLLTARDPRSRLRVLIGVRADFYARCAEHRGLADAMHGAGLLVGPMNAEELREAVVKPAQAACLIVERELTARIVEDVLDEPGGLPMLSHALLETWRRRKGRTLTLAAYEAVGGVHGAVAASAEAAYAELSEAQAHTARQLLLRLIEPGQGNADTRRPLTRGELAEWPDPEVGVVSESLARARLLTVDEEGVHLAHEALITCWPRLRGWIEEDRERLRHHRRLTEAAGTWLEHDRDPGTLYRGTRLARAEELFAGDNEPRQVLTVSEQAFLDAAVENRVTEHRAVTRTRRRSRALAAALSAVLVVASLIGLGAWHLQRETERQRTDTAARRVAEVAGALRTTDPRTAMLLGVAAWRISPLPESRRALLGALSQPELSSFTDPAPGAAPLRFLVDSGRTLLSVSGRTWRAWNVDTHRRIRSGPLPEGTAIAAGPDGRVIVMQQDNGAQRLWDTHAERWTGTSPAADATVDFAASGRSYLVSGSDGKVRLYSGTGGGPRFETTAGLSGVAVDADGRQLAVCPEGRTPQVWNIAGHRELPGAWNTARGTCDNDLTTLALTRGRLVLLGPDDLRIWNTVSGRRVAVLPDPKARFAALSPDGTFLATADRREVSVWRLSAPGAPVFRYPLGDQRLEHGFTWDPDRPLLRYLEAGTVHTLDLTTTATASWRKNPVGAVRLSPDDHTLATAELIGERYVFELRDTRDGHLVRTLPSSPLPVSADRTWPVVPRDTLPLLAFSPEGGTLAYGVTVPGREAAPQRLTFWDVAREHERGTLDLATPSATGAAVDVALGPDGRTLHLARVSRLGDVIEETWDTTRRRRTAVLNGRTGSQLVVSPSRNLVVFDGLVVRAGRARARDLVQDGEVGALAFSPDGGRLAVGDQTGRVALWDGTVRHRAGILRSVFPVPFGTDSDSGTDSDDAEAVTALAFSPDGGTLAVGGAAGTLQLWDTATQQPLGGPLPTPGESIDTLAFSRDNRTLYAGSGHVPLQRYVVDPGRAVSLVCARTGGADLTRAQWHTYIPDAPYHRLCT